MQNTLDDSFDLSTYIVYPFAACFIAAQERFLDCWEEQLTSYRIAEENFILIAGNYYFQHG